MAGDIYVTFGAETGALEAAIKRAQATLKGFTSEAVTTLREMAKAGAGMDSELGAHLKEVGASATAARTKIAELKAALSGKASGSGAAEEIEKVNSGLNRMQQMEGVHVIKSIFDEIAAGQSPLRAVAMEGGRIAQIFTSGGIGLGLGAAAAGLVAVGAAAAYFITEAKAAEGIAESLRNGLTLSGHGALMSDADMAEVASRINALRGWFSGLGEDEAKALARGFRDVPGMVKEIGAEVTALIPDLAKGLDLKEADVGKKLQEALKASDAEGSIKVLIDLFGGLSEAHRAELEATDASLDQHVREAAVLRVSAEAIKQKREELIRTIDAEIAEKKSQTELLGSMPGMGSWAESIRERIRLLEDEKKKIEAAIAATRANTDAINAQKSSTADLARAWEDTLDKMDPAGKAMREMADNAEKIRAGLSGVNWPGAGPSSVESGGGGGAYGPTVSGDALSFLRSRAGGGAHVEGLNAIYAGLAAKAIADAEAATGAKASFNSAYRDPDSKETQDLWEKSGHGTKFTMAEPHTSAHGVGAAMDLNAGPVLDWLHAHIGNYPGLEFLPARLNDPGHLQYAGGRTGMVEANARANMVLGETADAQQARRDKLAGGSVVDKQELADLQAIAAQKHDDLQAEKDRIAALEEQRSKTSEANAQRQLDGQIATENAKKIQMETAAKEAQLRLDVAAAKGDPDAQHAAEVKLAEFRRQQAENLHGKGSPEAISAGGEVKAADDRYADAKSTLLERDAANQIRLAHEAGNEARKVLDDNQAHHKITVDRWQADTEAANKKEETAIRAQYARLLEDDNLTAAKRKDIENKRDDEIRRIGQKTTDDARKANNERASSANAIARENAQEEMRAARDKASFERSQVDNAVSHGRMSEQDGLARKLQINAEETAAVQAAMEKELSIQDQSDAEKLRKEHELQDRLRQLRQQGVQDQQKAADAQSQAMEGYANTIFGPVNSAIRSAMSGHANMRQIAIRAAQDMGMKALEWIEKEIVKHLLGEATMTAATVTGEAARNAAKAGGTAANAGAVVANALKTISTSAGEAFAGVFGFTAPLLGPAAAGPAAAASATVMSVAGGMVASADIGMWQVPRDQLTMVHHNELVATPSQADAIRSLPGILAAGGGGAGGASVSVNPQMHVHASMMDATGLRNFIRNNQREFVAGMHAAVRSGAHLGLKAVGS